VLSRGKKMLFLPTETSLGLYEPESDLRLTEIVEKIFSAYVQVTKLDLISSLLEFFEISGK